MSRKDLDSIFPANNCKFKKKRNKCFLLTTEAVVTVNGDILLAVIFVGSTIVN